VFDPGDGPDGGFEAMLARELGAPVPTDAARKARIMELVRGAAARPRRPGVRERGRGARSGWASPVVGVAIAAGFAGVVTLGTLRSAVPLDGGPGSAAAAAALGDTVAAAIRDTARLVRFMLVAPTASRVGVAGDFNGWDASATPLVAAESGGVWSAAVALTPGRHRYAFVVDDTQWVTDPQAPHRSEGGRRVSVLTVADTAN
jgi:hypothetical protein